MIDIQESKAPAAISAESQKRKTINTPAATPAGTLASHVAGSVVRSIVRCFSWFHWALVFGQRASYASAPVFAYVLAASGLAVFITLAFVPVLSTITKAAFLIYWAWCLKPLRLWLVNTPWGLVKIGLVQVMVFSVAPIWPPLFKLFMYPELVSSGILRHQFNMFFAHEFPSVALNIVPSGFFAALMTAGLSLLAWGTFFKKYTAEKSADGETASESVTPADSKKI